MKKYVVAIVGATGAVGTQMLACLEEQQFPVGALKLLASPRSAGRRYRDHRRVGARAARALGARQRSAGTMHARCEL